MDLLDRLLGHDSPALKRQADSNVGLQETKTLGERRLPPRGSESVNSREAQNAVR
jgi:hypothetical protein